MGTEASSQPDSLFLLTPSFFILYESTSKLCAKSTLLLLALQTVTSWLSLESKNQHSRDAIHTLKDRPERGCTKPGRGSGH